MTDSAYRARNSARIGVPIHAVVMPAKNKRTHDRASDRRGGYPRGLSMGRTLTDRRDPQIPDQSQRHIKTQRRAFCNSITSAFANLHGAANWSAPICRRCCSAPSRRGYLFVMPLGRPATCWRSSFSACCARISSCLRSALKLALVQRSWAAAALTAHLSASCRRCSERARMPKAARTALQRAAFTVGGTDERYGPLTVRALRQRESAH